MGSYWDDDYNSQGFSEAIVPALVTAQVSIDDFLGPIKKMTVLEVSPYQPA
jgi:hypothetical protein